MRVLMLGWEFPPYISGGLGTACYGLTQGLSQLGTEIIFVLPHAILANTAAGMKLLGPGSKSRSGSTYTFEKLPGVKFKPVNVKLYPYAGSGAANVPVALQVKKSSAAGASSTTPNPKFMPKTGGHYAGDLFSQVHRYADLVGQIASQEDFDVIHAHDWMTYPAAVAAADVSGKPLVVHVHSTERDRSGDGTNDAIYQIERYGMHRADRVIVVSRFTQRICMEHYALCESKVHVVYNAVAPIKIHNFDDTKGEDEKVVLFLGRITMQKGPEYFLYAAKRVLEIVDNVKFIMAGTGDMFHRMVHLAAELGIGNKVLFTGFLQGESVARAFKMADLYVMPSVSEPFGIAPLEALSHNVPVMISKQSGVSEVLTHVLKVDFWDVNEIANKMAAVLKYPALPKTLKQHSQHELGKFDWTDSARKCMEVYRRALSA
jgi:glycogen(starch) synthase